MRFGWTLLLLLIAGSGLAQGGFKIRSFDVTIVLGTDATFTVEERIAVAFLEPRRGIIRMTPVAAENRWGATRALFVTGLEVRSADGAVPVKVDREGRYLRVRAGDPEVVLPAGTERTYIFRYRVANGLNWYDDASDWEPYAELFWNVTGTEWTVPIERVTWRVKFPANGPRGLRARVYSGPFRSTASDTLATVGEMRGERTGTRLTLAPGQFSGEKDAPLPPANGVTIVLNMPARTIPEPERVIQIWYVLWPNLGFGIPLVVLLGVGFAAYRYGRDPKAFKMYVRFEPPEGLGGAEVGALIDEKVDQRDVAAALFSLGVKGCLVIVPDPGGRDATIELTGADPKKELTPAEAYILGRLQTQGPSLMTPQLRAALAPAGHAVRARIYGTLVERGFYRTSPETVRGVWMLLGVMAVLAMGALTLFANPTRSALPSIVGGVAGVLCLLPLVRLMPRRTQAGALAYQEAAGFARFIRAGKDRTEWLAQKHPDAALFEQYLPHAIALGLVAEWAGMFSGILTAPPEWYASDPHAGFDAMHFGTHLWLVSNTLGHDATTPDRVAGGDGSGGGGSWGDSGFSDGGGFSGGGFGGGGGDSW